MAKQRLYLDVQFNGIKRNIQILDVQPVATRYEKIIQLPSTCVNDMIYDVTLYVDGMDIDEYEAKQLVVDILGSPIWRAKMLSIVFPMPHEAF